MATFCLGTLGTLGTSLYNSYLQRLLASVIGSQDSFGSWEPWELLNTGSQNFRSVPSGSQRFWVLFH